MKAVLPSIVVAFAFCGCAAFPVEIPGQNVRSKILHYPEFSKYLEARTHAPVYQIRFQRDSIGSKLFINFYFPKGDEPVYRTLIAEKTGLRELSGYPRVWYDGEEKPVFRLEGVKEWYEGEKLSRKFFSRFEDANYVFKNGPVIPFREISQIEGITGSDLVLLRFGRKSAWIVSKSETPRQAVIELPANLDHPQCACASTNELILFGTFSDPQRERIVKCLIYRMSSTGNHLVEEIQMPWAGTVFDFYPPTGEALFSGTATKFAGYYQFNIHSKKRKRLTAAPDASLFLQEGVISTLDAEMGQ